MKKQIQQIISTVATGVLLALPLSAQSTLFSEFDFEGNLSDQFSVGACNEYSNLYSFIGSGLFVWAGDSTRQGGGLVISIPDAAITETDYTVSFRFQIDQTNGYRKLIDFSNLSSDAGLYVNNSLRLYPSGGYGATAFNPANVYSVVFERNGLNDSAIAYLFAGNQLVSESRSLDANMDYVPVLVGGNRVFHFFHDDSLTLYEFSPTGLVDQIRFYNGIADPSDIMTGIPATDAAPAVGLFPNPATDQATIRFSVPQTGTLEVFDVLGNCVSREMIEQEQTHSIHTESWARGVYFIRLNEISIRLVKE